MFFRQVGSLVLGLALLVVLAKPARPAPALRVEVFNPGAGVSPDCEADFLEAYANTSEKTQRLQALDMFIGLFRGAYADVVIEVYIIPVDPFAPWQPVASIREDRYQDPLGGDQQHFVTFAPSYIALRPGEKLQVNALNCPVSGIESPMHPVVWFYFLQE